METKIQKWGNSLGLRIPKAFAKEAGVEAGSAVDISLEGGNLVIKPKVRRYKLSDLLEDVTSENLHEAVDFGPPTGNEAW